jgi:hypothetical protein
MTTLQYFADLYPFSFLAFLFMSDTGLQDFGLSGLEVLLG